MNDFVLHNAVYFPFAGISSGLINFFVIDIKKFLWFSVCIFQAGDRVFTTETVSGGYAEYTIASEDCVYKLPDALDYNQGAAIGIPYFTAYRSLIHM